MNINESTIILSKVVSILCPIVAIVILAQKNIADSFGKNEQTMWVLVLGLILCIVGAIFAKSSMTKDFFAKASLALNIGIAIICGSVFCSYIF